MSDMVRFLTDKELAPLQKHVREYQLKLIKENVNNVVDAYLAGKTKEERKTLIGKALKENRARNAPIQPRPSRRRREMPARGWTSRKLKA